MTGPPNGKVITTKKMLARKEVGLFKKNVRQYELPGWISSYKGKTMLPLDSEKWGELTGTYGRTGAHLMIKEFVDFLDTDPSETEITEKFSEFGHKIYDELSHQQNTWTGTTAAMPHLLAIAKRLPSDCRCTLWADLGLMNIDSAGYIDDDQLVSWYDAAIEQAAVDSVAFAKNRTLSDESQFHLYWAIANFRYEDYLHYAFRAHEYMTQFECVHCESEFEAELIEQGEVFAFVNSDKLLSEQKTCRIVPCSDILKASRREGQRHFSLIASIAVENNHQAIAGWLAKRLGDFQCPVCEKDSWAVEYGARD